MLTARTKALLLKLENTDHETLVTLKRLNIDPQCIDPDSITKMISDTNQIINYLKDHPKVTIKLGYCLIEISTPTKKDIKPYNKNRPPFKLLQPIVDYYNGFDSYHKQYYCSYELQGTDTDYHYFYPS